MIIEALFDRVAKSHQEFRGARVATAIDKLTRPLANLVRGILVFTLYRCRQVATLIFGIAEWIVKCCGIGRKIQLTDRRVIQNDICFEAQLFALVSKVAIATQLPNTSCSHRRFFGRG